MANTSTTLRGNCPLPFYQEDRFGDGGYTTGRLCKSLGQMRCCLPCPMTDWAYPDNFSQLTSIASWINVVGMICCLFLLISWIVLPVEKTHRHYLSICLTVAVVLMNLGFIIPLAGKPDQCYDEITPNGMASSPICAASGSFLLLGGWGGVMWIFLRALSLHLQICWQMVVGRSFMWLSQALGWGIPVIGLTVLLIFSGVSFRFGQTCHINHQNSLADFWIPLLVFAGLTVIIQFATFGYCIKVYLASLADSTASTENSGLPAYSSSIRTMTPRQAYRRVRRVIQLQWRGIVIVLIIICDVIFFAVTFVFLDNTLETVKNDPNNAKAQAWIICLYGARGDKNKCLKEASAITVSLPTVIAMLILLAVSPILEEGRGEGVLTQLKMNGIWLLILLGRWSMVDGWKEYLLGFGGNRTKKEFVSVDARLDLKKDPRSYEMLSRDSGKAESILTPISATKSPVSPRSGRQTPDYFGPAATRYQPHSRSFSSPRPPQSQQVTWETQPAFTPPPQTFTPQPQSRRMADGSDYEDMNPLGMNRI
ncbi:hypothetical protein JX265_005561 [Neoarthrinium moseri]|uniref:G-protein coupled receptors family 2 profile 2 domain-containing protein n=1 Tax=Neoarthrinium moseri TaxID=1658444 RepID=A0A9P9WNU7_9PEZI|nr:uncharacterized protein JN550_010287 [Neoarthrinium moseri]KAI1847380.1 hypothetical protein JX266_006605 [Neoarthrinium moseri]KAI1862280.1 hypothetical protein JN550_010287 [Neoarthrinium moseri]KAI1872681.1 hypothetical protein JX265_005561 [Neoarthrinium moseri]